MRANIVAGLSRHDNGPGQVRLHEVPRSLSPCGHEPGSFQLCDQFPDFSAVRRVVVSTVLFEDVVNRQLEPREHLLEHLPAGEYRAASK